MNEQDSLFNWEDLKYFLSLADARTLSAAARQLHVTHATISRRVKHLEEKVGAPLFDQQPHGFELTDLGLSVYRHVELMEQHVANIADVTEYTGPEGLVRISATPALCDYLIFNILPEFHKAYPKINIEIIGETRNLSLARHEAHIGLRLSRPQSGEFVIRKLCDMGYGLFIASANTSEDLKKLPKVDYTLDYSSLPESLWLHENYPENPILIRTNSLSSNKLAIEKGFGFGLLPFYVVSEKDPLRQLNVEEVLPQREVWMAMRGTLNDVPRIRIVADYLYDEFKKKRSQFVTHSVL